MSHSPARAFFRGLAVLIPLVVTLALVGWLIALAERSLGAAMRWLLPEAVHFPGMGLLTAILLAIAVGYLLEFFFVRRIVAWGEGLLKRLPLVKTVYGAIKDTVDFLGSGRKKKELDQVVLVRVHPDFPPMTGFLTREDLSPVSAELAQEDRVAVYLPMSYQIGGYTVFVPRESITPLDLDVEDGMRFVMTAGMSLEARDTGRENA